MKKRRHRALRLRNAKGGPQGTRTGLRTDESPCESLERENMLDLKKSHCVSSFGCGSDRKLCVSPPHAHS